MQTRKMVAMLVLLGMAVSLPVAGYGKSFRTVNGVAYFEAKPGKFYKLRPGTPPPALTTALKQAPVKFAGRSKGPAAVDLSAQMPPVGDCGNQNSTAAWATTYYLKTFQEAREHGWSVNTAAHQYSPAFTYNQTNYGTDNGVSLTNSLQSLVDKGATTLAEQPYSDTDYSSWPTLAQYQSALPARAQSYTQLFRGYGKGAAQLQAMKDILAGGDVFVVSIAMYADFAVSSPNYLYNYPVGSTYVGQLPLVITGYDDTIGGLGGFKFRTCWGTDWGNGGSGYLSYNCVSNLAYEAYTMTDRIGYEPQVWSRITIQHPRRMDLTLTVMHGDAAAPDWSTVVYANQGAYGQNIDCYVDLSDYGHLDGNWWLRLDDRYASATGSLTRFSLLAGSAEIPSTDVPLTIPDMSSAVARVRWLLDTYTLQVVTGGAGEDLSDKNYATVNYTRYGVPGTLRLWDGKTANVEADAGVGLQFSDASSASNIAPNVNRRWKLAPLAKSPLRAKGASKAQTIVATYYEQYRKLFATSTKTDSPLTADNYAVLQYQSCGATAAANVWDGLADDAAVWADKGSHWSFSATSKRSSATERWTTYCVPASGGGTTPAPPGVADNEPVLAAYWHQFRPLLTLAGTDKTHLVSLLQRSLCNQEVLGSPRSGKWNDWVDDGSTLAVSATTSGTPARKTLDPTSWTVADSFAATLHYRAYYIIAGKVSAKGGAAVAGVLVKAGALETTTGKDGLFRFEDLDPGTYTIVASKVGCAFAPPQIKATVGSAQGSSLDNAFVLTTVPSVLAWSPQGSAVAPTSALTMDFSEPMSPEKVAAALTLQETFAGSASVGPALLGSCVWTNGNKTLTFTPATRLKAYRNYRVTLSTKAESALGGPLAEDLQWTFQTKDCLAVVAYSPTAAAKAPCNAPVVVNFDRDVALATAKQYFSLSPRVTGTLKLLTPRKLQFQPLTPLANNSTYKVTLGANMAGLDKIKLLKPFSWSFTTEGPAQILSATPTGKAVALSSKVVVTFDRAMHRSRTQAAFSLRIGAPALAAADKAAGGSATPPSTNITGSFAWNSAGTVMTFTPARWLQKSAPYLIGVTKTALSAAGAPLAANFQSGFTTANTLQVLAATPTGAEASINSVIRFTCDRAVKPETLKLTVAAADTSAGAVEGTTTWSGNTATFTPRYALTPATPYTASIADTLTAVDGTKLGAAYGWSFTTHGLTRVVAYSPRGSGVKPGAPIVIRFDRPMDQASVAANLQVLKVASTPEPVAGKLTWDEGGTRVTFTPLLGRLASFTDYHVVLTANALSTDNLALASKLEWIFQTARAVQIVAYAPTGVQVSASAAIEVQFDRKMARTWVQKAFTIQPSVPGAFTWSDSYHLRFQPTAPLTPGRTYRVRLSTGARALTNLSLVSPFEFSFTVGSAGAVGVAPLTVTAAQTTGGNVAISFTLASPAQVEVQVRNLAGRPIAVLSPAGLSGAGASTVLWNGKSASGSRAPAGTYLVQVAVRGATGSHSASVTPLQLR